MTLAHIGGVPVEESLAYLLPVVIVVGLIYWSSFRERRRAERADDDREAGDAPRPAGAPDGVPSEGRPTPPDAY